MLKVKSDTITSGICSTLTVKIDNEHMNQALDLAHLAAANNEVPVGAVLVRGGRIIGSGYNQTQSLNDPTAHAEIIAIRNAAADAGDFRLLGSTLYVTLEPCCMCVGALVQARIAKLVFGAREARTGAVVSAFELLMSGHHNHRVAIREGVLAAECAELMQSFFRSRR